MQETQTVKTATLRILGVVGRTQTLAGALLAGGAGGAGPALLLLAEEAADGGLDALLLGGLVERVLAAVAAAGVAVLAVLEASRATQHRRGCGYIHSSSQ